MDYCSRRVNHKQSSVALMLTGAATPMTANLQLATCSRLVVQLSHGRVKNNHVLPCLLQKQSILL